MNTSTVESHEDPAGAFVVPWALVADAAAHASVALVDQVTPRQTTSPREGKGPVDIGHGSGAGTTGPATRPDSSRTGARPVEGRPGGAG